MYVLRQNYKISDKGFDVHHYCETSTSVREQNIVFGLMELANV